MIKKFHHYRDFEFEKHVFFFSDVPPTNIEKGKVLRDENGENLSDNQFKKQSWRELENSKRKEYRAALHETASRLTGKSGREEGAFSEPIKSTMRGSRSRFEKAVSRIREDYYEATRPPELAYKQARRRVNREVRQNLRGLRRSVKATMALETIEKRDMPEPTNKQGLKRYFRQYKKALNKRYFNSRLDRAGGVKYMEKVHEFDSDMNQWVKRCIRDLQEGDSPESAYETLKGDMKARYKKYAYFDGDPSSISLKDLKILERRTHPSTPEEMAADFNNNEEAQSSLLEDESLATPEKWQFSTSHIADETLDRVQSDKAEASFVKVINERISPVKDFESAKKVYKKRMRKIGKLGSEKTLAFSKSLNIAIFDDTFDLEKEAYEGPLGLQTRLQMQYMQSGTITPPKPTDRMLITFINAHEQERSEILRDPKRRADLFQGIKEATEAYPVELEGRFTDFDEDNKPQRNRKIADPEPDDLTARLKALIVLGEQSAILVERYGYGDQLSEVEVDPEEVRADLKFVVHGDGRIPPQYQPGIARAGFNGTDIILRGTQVATCLMLVSNLAYQVRSADGANGVEKWTNGIVNAVTSPHTLAYAALAYGTTKVIKDKRYINYPWLGPYGKEGLNTADKLNGIAEKTSPKYMNEFRNSMAEWQILKRIEEADKMEEVMELVGNQEGQKTINAALLVKAGVLEENGDHLIKQKMANSARTRYLFYDKFRGKKVKSIKQHCTGSVFIESESEQVSNND